jgi:hypothetical protein
VNLTADPITDAPAALADEYVRTALDRGSAELAGVLARNRGFVAALREAFLRRAGGRRLDATVDTRLDLAARFLDEVEQAITAGRFFETPEDALDREAYAAEFEAGREFADEVLVSA